MNMISHIWMAKSHDRLIAWCGLVGFCLPPLVSAQPANDLFADRLVQEQATFEGEWEGRGAGFEAEEPMEMLQFGEGSLWWEWTAPTSDRYTISTAESDFDSILGVYAGREWGALELVAFNDDEDLVGGVFTSRITFFAVAGRTYQISVGALKDSVSDDQPLKVKLQLQTSAGKPLDPWTVNGLGNDTVFDSTQLSGDLWIIDFWATWCVPCRAEIPIFNELQTRYADRGLRVLGVSVDTVGNAEVLDFAEAFPIEFPIAMTRRELESVFGGVTAIPTAIVLDASNRVLAKHVGFRDRDFWFEEIESLLAPAGALQLPELEIQLLTATRQIQLSWPSHAGEWRLESAQAINTTWSVLDVEPENDGTRIKVQLPMDVGKSRFFRLTRP